MCLVLSKIRSVKNRKTQKWEFLQDFWMLRLPTGSRLSKPKRQKAAKIHASGRLRITLVTLSFYKSLSGLVRGETPYTLNNKGHGKDNKFRDLNFFKIVFLLAAWRYFSCKKSNQKNFTIPKEAFLPWIFLFED